MLRDRIFELREQGMTYSQIKAELNCSKSTISYYLGDGQVQKSQDRTNSTRATIRAWIVQDKESKVCADCKTNYPYWVLQYDHLPQYEKLFNIAQYRAYTSDLKVVQAEVTKCEVVCANCHASRTHWRRVALSGTISDDDEFFEDELD